VEFTDADDLPADGTPVLVTPSPRPGTAAALLAAMSAEPHIGEADAAELEAAIATGRRVPAKPVAFGDRSEPGGATP
jgi:hypothetical protein